VSDPAFHDAVRSAGPRPRRERPGRRSAADATATDAAVLAELVNAARGGDRDAFDRLVTLTWADAFTLAHRLTGNDDDARDVVQDAYLRAYRGLHRFRGDASFTTWLYRITANCAATTLAKRARTRTEPLPDDEPLADVRVEHDPARRAEAEQDRGRVAEALEALPWRLRQVVVLRDIYDLSHGAIARELGITEAAAKVRLHRARRRLREGLADKTAAGAPEPDDHGEADRAG
jgi:RNA polymerase sigma-70 factor (ECF subfamily)